MLRTWFWIRSAVPEDPTYCRQALYSAVGWDSPGQGQTACLAERGSTALERENQTFCSTNCSTLISASTAPNTCVYEGIILKSPARIFDSVVLCKHGCHILTALTIDQSKTVHGEEQQFIPALTSCVCHSVHMQGKVTHRLLSHACMLLASAETNKTDRRNHFLLQKMPK